MKFSPHSSVSLAFTFLAACYFMEQAKAQFPPPLIPSNEYARWVDVNGDTAVVSAQEESTQLGSNVGAVYVFRRSGNTWTQEARLTSLDPAAFEQFGRGLALDGDDLAVGVPADNDPLPGGSVQLFHRSGTTWNHSGRITLSPNEANFAEVMTMDAGYLAIGRSGAGGWGEVLLFQINGGNWSGPIKLFASDPTAGDNFGASVALDGNQLAVGAPGCDIGTKTNAGAAYIFSVNSFFPNQIAKVSASNGQAGEGLGYSVAIKGNRLVAGAPYQSRAGLWDGAAYIFAANPTWAQQATLTVPANATFYTSFGGEVAISGNFVMIGSDYAKPYGGRIQIYQRVDTSWLRRGVLATDFTVDTRFPTLAFDATTLVAGYPVSGTTGVYSLAPTLPEREIMVFTGSGDSLRETPAGQTLNLGDAWLNQSQDWKFTVFNDGGTNLELTAADLAPGSNPEISVTPLNGLPFGFTSIAPGEALTVTVRTQFGSAGNKSGTLRLSTNDADEPTYSIPLLFNATPQPAPAGLKLRLENSQALLTYPHLQFSFYQVERSSNLNSWDPIGFMSLEFEASSQTNVRIFRDFNPPIGKSFYRLKVF